MIRSGRVPEELWTETCSIVQVVVTETITKKKRINPFECRVPKKSKEI